MGSGAHIGLMNTDGSITYIYVRFDGYVTYTGMLLLTVYNTAEKVRQLIESGSADALQADPAAMKFYKGTDGKPVVYNAPSMVDFATNRKHDAESMYVFHRYGLWFVRMDMGDVAMFDPSSTCRHMTSEEWEAERDSCDYLDDLWTWVPLTTALSGSDDLELEPEAACEPETA